MSKRPDSAKTQQTKQTYDSQHSKKDLNSSKFSQTLSEGVSIYGQKTDSFERYVAQKDKDPKFKNLKSKLQIIQEKRQRQQPQKVNNKPFQIKRGTIEKHKNQVQRQKIEKNDKHQKIQEKQQKSQRNSEQIITSSKGFAERNKKIMDSLNPQKSQKTQKLQKTKEAEKIKENTKAKIDFGSFKVNNTKVKQVKKLIKQESTKKQQQKVMKEQKVLKQQKIMKKQEEPSPIKKQQEKPNTVNPKKVKQSLPKKGKTQQEQNRLNELKNLQSFVNQIQQRNLPNFPPNYDTLINRMSTSRVSDLQKIDLDQFLIQPTQGQYQMLRNRIRANDDQLQRQKVEEESINLEDIVRNTQQEDHEHSRYSSANRQRHDENDYQQEGQDDDASIYASISAQQMRKRNAFITEILAGKISKHEIQRFQEMNRSTLRMYRIDHEKQQKEQEQRPQNRSQINIMKKQSNRLIQRNKLEAAGKLYKDCDYLSQEHQQRLEQLLSMNSVQEIESPFQYDQLRVMQNRRIDQGIRMYRQMNHSTQQEDQGRYQENEEHLPKDPQLKKEAQKKILKERIASVNSRLSEVDKITVTKGKIESLIKRYEHTRKSQNYTRMSEHNRLKLNEQLLRLKEAESILQKLGDKQNMEQLLLEIDQEYSRLQQQIKVTNQIDAKELMRLEKERLKRKMKDIEEIEKMATGLNQEIQSMEVMKKEVQVSLRGFQGIVALDVVEMQCQGYAPGETLQDIDRVISMKMQNNTNMNTNRGNENEI